MKINSKQINSLSVDGGQIKRMTTTLDGRKIVLYELAEEDSFYTSKFYLYPSGSPFSSNRVSVFSSQAGDKLTPGVETTLVIEPKDICSGYLYDITIVDEAGTILAQSTTSPLTFVPTTEKIEVRATVFLFGVTSDTKFYLPGSPDVPFYGLARIGGQVVQLGDEAIRPVSTTDFVGFVASIDPFTCCGANFYPWMVEPGDARRNNSTGLFFNDNIDESIYREWPELYTSIATSCTSLVTRCTSDSYPDSFYRAGIGMGFNGGSDAPEVNPREYWDSISKYCRLGRFVSDTEMAMSTFYKASPERLIRYEVPTLEPVEMETHCALFRPDYEFRTRLPFSLDWQTLDNTTTYIICWINNPAQYLQPGQSLVVSQLLDVAAFQNTVTLRRYSLSISSWGEPFNTSGGLDAFVVYSEPGEITSESTFRQASSPGQPYEASYDELIYMKHFAMAFQFKGNIYRKSQLYHANPMEKLMANFVHVLKN